ncbi:MAG: ABC transporter permease [Planctomycetaceae bacterium]|nr:ABC transporter permease [Planctomycetota bacterium]NUN51549.1 ABC transporter permease [Planctomycetaceae bacterium]
MKSYVPFLSLRYLWFHKVSSTLGILGVTLGVGLVIVVVGVMDGFQSRLKASLIGNTTPVVVQPFYDLDALALCEALKREVPGVVEASPVVYAMTLAAPEGKRLAQGLPVRVIGIDAPLENRVSDLAAKLRRGRTPESPLSLLESATPEQPFRTPDSVRATDRRIRPEKQGVVLGRTLLDRLRLRPGDRVQIPTLLERRDGEGAGGGGLQLVAQAEVFTVTGSFDSGDYEFNDVVLMDRRDAMSFFKEGIPREANALRLRLSDPDDCDAVKAAIEALAADLPDGSFSPLVAATRKKGGLVEPRPLEVRTWKDLNRNILDAVENERALLIVITGFSFIVVAFLIGSTQSMLVVEKTREIGVLRSLGASVAGTSSVFLGNGFFIGAIGAASGLGVGLAITSNIQGIIDGLRRMGVDLFPESIYRFRELPIDVKGPFVLSILAGAVVFSLLGSLLPAVRAATLDPVESLHHE